MTDADEEASLGFDAVPDAKPQSFALAEMITCDTCLRANPPTRSNCLYCGAILPLSEYAPAPLESVVETKPPAKLNSGFYVVLAPTQTNPTAE